MELSKQQLRSLKSMAHALHPIAWIGQKGLTTQMIEHLDSRIRDHELIKIKIGVDDKQTRRQLAQQICQVLQTTLVQFIGKTATLYRPAQTGEGKHSHLHRSSFHKS